ncbi:MAG: hypothetical protein P8R42_17540 [Candidatus Binatia bacterium]|nr:hypothetical protein [Candidatus Binatia bacterium]
MKHLRAKRRFVVCVTTFVLVVLAVLSGELALRLGFPSTTSHQRWVTGAGGSGPKLLILGDSFFSRLPAHEDIHDHLLEQVREWGIQILNPSRPGIGPHGYLELFVEAAQDFRPDVILVSHYVGNDLLDLGCTREIDQVMREATLSPLGRDLWRTSFLLLYLEDLARRYAMRSPDFDWSALEARGIPVEDIGRAKRFEVNPWVLGLGESRPSYYRETLLVDSDCAQRAWANTIVVLDEILLRAHALGAVVVPVVFPHTLQVNELHHALYASWQLEVDESMLQARRPQELLREYYASRGITMLDLLPPFKAAAERLYWDTDEHLAPAGQALAAREIAVFLASRPELVAP